VSEKLPQGLCSSSVHVADLSKFSTSSIVIERPPELRRIALVCCVAMASYRPLDMYAYMETAERPTLLRDVYSSPHVCKENALGDETITAMLNQLTSRGILKQITITTGGGFNGVRFPVIAAWRGSHEVATVKSNNQFKLSKHVGGVIAFNEIQAYYRLHPGLGSPPSTMNEVNLSLSAFMWRYTHCLPTGRYPLIPVSVEISHLAEGYSFVNRELWGNAKVEVTQLEGHDVNESRKYCSLFGLMWRKPDGSIIRQGENYSGATLCPHSAAGSPCYGPHPSAWRTPTGLTPNPRKAGKKTKRGDGSGGSSNPKKPKTLDKGQRRLSFSAQATM
jgi:hypothetical protein